MQVPSIVGLGSLLLERGDVEGGNAFLQRASGMIAAPVMILDVHLQMLDVCAHSPRAARLMLCVRSCKVTHIRTRAQTPTKMHTHTH